MRGQRRVCEWARGERGSFSSYDIESRDVMMEYTLLGLSGERCVRTRPRPGVSCVTTSIYSTQLDTTDGTNYVWLVPRVVRSKALPKVEFPACRPIATPRTADGQQATAIGCNSIGTLVACH